MTTKTTAIFVIIVVAAFVFACCDSSAAHKMFDDQIRGASSLSFFLGGSLSITHREYVTFIHPQIYLKLALFF